MTTPPWAIIVTWDSRDDVLACLDALARSEPRPHVVLVDNASRDGTVEAVTARFPQIEVIAHQRNLHFAAGANAGLRRALAAGAEWAWVLNPDAHPAPDALATLLQATGADPAIAIAGPRLVHPDGRAVIGAVCDFATGAVREPAAAEGDPPRDIDYVWGCAMLARTEALARIGLFDERFTAYFEDADLCLRARAAGYRVVGVPGARVDHFGGRAGDRRLLLQIYLRGRNWLWCFARHAPPGLRLRAVIAVAAYHLPRLALGSALWYIARKLRPRGRQVSLRV